MGVVTSEEVHDILCTYAEKHRPQPQPDFSEYVFLTPTGRCVTHLSEDLLLLSKLFQTEYGEIKCTATEMRKLTSTKVAMESKDKTTVRALVSHMTHSTDTAKAYYQQLQGTSESVKVFNIINSKVPDAVPGKRPRRMKM